MRALAIILLTSCATMGSEGPPIKHVQTGAAGYDIPDDWERTDDVMRGVATSVWAPKDNPQRMSVTVIRSERTPVIAASAPSTIDQLLLDAQRALPGVKLSAVAEISTAQGLRGARVELEYTPTTAKIRYHRTHVVLVDGKALLHVLFTAQSPDTFAAFDGVLASIRHEELHQ